MSDRKKALTVRPAAYAVGYGKPPAHSRFAPGRSGNSKGRPKGARNRAAAPGHQENRLQSIILDEAYRELGHWGPRPSELQAWVKENKETLSKEERLLHTRKWYARDRGETTIREVLATAGLGG